MGIVSASASWVVSRDRRDGEGKYGWDVSMRHSSWLAGNPVWAASLPGIPWLHEPGSWHANLCGCALCILLGQGTGALMRFSALERLDDPQRMRSAAVEMTTDTKRGPRDRAPHFRVSAHTGPSAWNARVFPRWATFHSVLSLHVTTLVKCPGHPLYSKTLIRIWETTQFEGTFIWSLLKFFKLEKLCFDFNYKIHLCLLLHYIF